MKFSLRVYDICRHSWQSNMQYVQKYVRKRSRDPRSEKIINKDMDWNNRYASSNSFLLMIIAWIIIITLSPYGVSLSPTASQWH